MNSDARNKQLLDLLYEIDTDGQDLTEWEVEFVARLLDADTREFTEREARRIVRVHALRVHDESET